MKIGANLYKYIPQKERKDFSLNFLLTNEMLDDSIASDFDFNATKEICTKQSTSDYCCAHYYKYISRYLENIGILELTKI